jgi:hypothetical protein
VGPTVGSLHGTGGGRRGGHGAAVCEGRCLTGSTKEEGARGLLGRISLLGQMATGPEERKRKIEIYFKNRNNSEKFPENYRKIRDVRMWS